MATLTLQTPPGTAVYELAGNDSWVLGRAETAELFVNALSVSRQHCRLYRAAGGGFYVEDLGSRAGTFVNGTRVATAVRLPDRARLRVGDLEFTFCEAAAAAAAPAPAAEAVRTMVGNVAAQAQGPSPEVGGKALAAGGVVRLGAAPLLLGRAPDCDVVLASPYVSTHHARITCQAGQHLLRDLNSANGTWLNQQDVTGLLPLRDGDRIRIGPYLLARRGDTLQVADQRGQTSLAARQVTRDVTNRETGRPLRLLDGISLTIAPNEFVALLGPSGSGKSTFMDILNGRRPCSSGQVLVNGEDLHRNFARYQTLLGYVPQRDIVHPQLTVLQAVRYAAELRLPPDTSPGELVQLVEAVIARMELTDRRHTLISQLSGGQVKRVSLAVELIARPVVLFADEVTSGLDAGTEARLMALFRELATAGMTVVCITHNIENVVQCDQAVVLVHGHLAYYGPPRDLPAYFGVTRVAEVYDHLATKAPADWAAAYRASPHYRELVAGRQGDATAQPATDRAPPARPAASGRQVHTLTRRYWDILVQDRRNVGLLLAQAPVIGALIGLVFRSQDAPSQQKLVVFLLTLAAIWFGCSNAAKEIVKELPIYLRERAVNLRLGAYLASKFLLLALLGLVQCVVLLAIVKWATGLSGDFVAQLPLLWLVAIAGTTLGLLVSAAVDSTDKAMAIVPLLLIPQVVLANVITDLGGPSLGLARGSIIAYWGFDGLRHTLADEVQDACIPPEVGVRIFPAGHTLATDVLVLLLFTAVGLGAAAWLLRRRDPDRQGRKAA